MVRFFVLVVDTIFYLPSIFMPDIENSKKIIYSSEDRGNV